MPLYDYKCGCCGLKFEDRQPMRNNFNATCPACGHNATRVFSPPRGENAVLIPAAFREGYTDTEPEVY